MASVTVMYVDSMREGYTQIARTVLNQGEETSPRGRKTWELVAPTIVLKDPTDALPVGINRKINLRIAAVEALQLIAGEAAPQLVLAASENFRRYQEEDGSFHGNYGARMGLQLLPTAERLAQDPASRQAVITLWDPERDLWMKDKRDYPCTVGFQFLIRDGALVMITTMRSNDVWLGLAYDVFQFTQLQIHLAAVLDVEVGAYVHRPGSLHIYEDDVENVLQLDEYPERGPIEDVREAMCVPGCTAKTLVSWSRRLLHGEATPATPSARWYAEQLGALRGPRMPW